MPARGIALIAASGLLCACLADIDLSKIPDAAVDDSGAAERALQQDGPGADQPAPDLPPNFCTSTWSNWSCVTKVVSASARCPPTGTEFYSLVCNKGGCSCTRIGGSNKKCAETGQDCSDAKKAFNAGCCTGL
jgi:hypothetical protein